MMGEDSDMVGAAVSRFTKAVLLSLTLLAGGSALGRDYGVSPAGDDMDADTGEKPFATPQRARDAVREPHDHRGYKAGQPSSHWH